MKLLLAMLLVPLMIPLLATPAFSQTNSQILPTEQGTLDVEISYNDIMPGEETKITIDFINPQTQETQIHIDYRVTVSKGEQNVFGPTSLIHTTEGTVKIPVAFADEGMYDVYVEVEGILFQMLPVEAASFTIPVGDVQEPTPIPDNGGGCLIATAAYGSELAPQVQQLRELRDGTVLSTESGTAFMNMFNQVYYSFSPVVADFEREQPVFRDAVKVSLVPMLTSLSLLEYVEIDSEYDILGYGISLILLNIGMYVGIPIFGALTLYRFKHR
ncbi:MAG: copper-binding protein [Thaumarchaeota archaeon]|nr:copper-binding protein [Nitrososphaerota archaeon]